MGSQIVASLKGLALMVNSKDSKLFGWFEEEKTWRYLGGPAVKNVASGWKGRLYKVDKNSEKVFR